MMLAWTWGHVSGDKVKLMTKDRYFEGRLVGLDE